MDASAPRAWTGAPRRPGLLGLIDVTDGGSASAVGMSMVRDGTQLSSSLTKAQSRSPHTWRAPFFSQTMYPQSIITIPHLY